MGFRYGPPRGQTPREPRRGARGLGQSARGPPSKKGEQFSGHRLPEVRALLSLNLADEEGRGVPGWPRLPRAAPGTGARLSRGRAVWRSCLLRSCAQVRGGLGRGTQGPRRTPSGSRARPWDVPLGMTAPCDRGLEGNPPPSGWRRGREHRFPMRDPQRQKHYGGVSRLGLGREGFVCSADCPQSQPSGEVGSREERERGEGRPAELISPQRCL